MIDLIPDIDSKIIHLIERNVSSIGIISEKLDVDPEKVRDIILRLAESGKLRGHLTSEGSRFFRSDVQRSEAPVVGSSHDLELKEVNVRPGVAVTTLGFAAYIVGNFLVRASLENTFLWGLGGAITLAGPIIIIVGLIIVSQLASSADMGRKR